MIRYGNDSVPLNTETSKPILRENCNLPKRRVQSPLSWYSEASMQSVGARIEGPEILVNDKNLLFPKTVYKCASALHTCLNTLTYE